MLSGSPSVCHCRNWRSNIKQRLKHRLFIGCSCIALALGAAGAAAGDVPAAGEHQPAVWQERKYSFAFLGFTSTYSCDGLADKLKILLRAAGARSDVVAQPGACARGFGRPDVFARADLTFYVLVPADGATAAAPPAPGAPTTPAAAARELTIPVSYDDKPIDGVWRTVSVTTRKPRDLGLGDCELVEQFKSNLLPLLSIRNVAERTTCMPHQDSGSVIDLKFESLVAAASTPLDADKPKQ